MKKLLDNNLHFNKKGFTVEKYVASGSYSAVFQGTLTKTGQEIAIKIPLSSSPSPFNKRNDNSSHNKSVLFRHLDSKVLNQPNHNESMMIEQEILTLQYLSANDQRHPNILSYEGHVIIYASKNIKDNSSFFSSFFQESIPVPCLLSEFCSNGDMLKMLKLHKVFNENLARSFFNQIVSGMVFAHSKGIVHLDLKLENLLLIDDRTLKIGDWGFAKEFKVGQKIDAYRGSVHYASPEIVNKQPFIGPEVDVWSMGVCLYAFVHGKLPFLSFHQDESKKANQIASHIRNNDYQLNKDLSEELKNLIQNIIQPDSNLRFTMHQIQSHPWFTKQQQK